MLHWSMLGELYSLFILILLFIRYYMYERDVAKTSRKQRFIWCLLLSMVYIALNILCVVTLEQAAAIPRWVHISLNTLYFLGSIGLCSFFAYMLFDAILEHVYDKHCIARARIMLCLVNGIAVVLLIANLFTGIVFTVDEACVYHRGPLNRSFYGLMLLELVFLGVCFFRNRSSIGDRMIYVMRSVPPIVVILCVLQLLYPHVLLNGTICSVVSLVLFIAFRSHTEDRDSMTGASSRKSFMNELELRANCGQAVQIVMVRLGNLADINLRYGHTVGDALLYEVSHYLRHSLPHIQVFRIGSTVFTVVLPLEDEQTAHQYVRAVDTRMKQEWVLGEDRCQLTASIAELRSTDLTGRPSEIVERLEYTMGMTQQYGSPLLFNEEVRQKLDHRTRIVELMRRAIKDRKFYVVYQPVYCCHRDLFCSAEALLRLRDDDGTPISPEIFIPLAEEYDMISDLTWFVLDEICRLLCSRDLPGLESVSLNLSMQQLLDPGLPLCIKGQLDRYGISPDRLKLEITERFILHDAKYAATQLAALEKIGLQIYMDDFGTGYSNLSSVLNFPCSFVKLDRSLISPLPGSQQAGIMVRTLLQLFHDLGKRAIAEGVETAEQAAYLKEVGADMIQGFYYARPTAPKDLLPYFGATNPPMLFK